MLSLLEYSVKKTTVIMLKLFLTNLLEGVLTKYFYASTLFSLKKKLSSIIFPGPTDNITVYNSHIMPLIVTSV